MAAGTALRLFTTVDFAVKLRQLIGKLVFTVLLPALVLHVLSTASLNLSWITVPLIAAANTAICFIVAWVVFSRNRALSGHSVGSLILASAWGNVTYLGLPVITGLYGPDLRIVPILYDQLAVTPLLFTIGVMVCVRYGVKGLKHTLASGISKAATTPAILATVAGILVNLSGLHLPTGVDSVLASTGWLVSPLMLFSVGLALRRPSMHLIRPLAPALLIKLVFSPAIGYVLVSVFLGTSVIAHATVLESAMPSMVLPMVFAERYGLDEDLLAQAILWTTAMSMVTLPMVGMWLG